MHWPTDVAACVVFTLIWLLLLRAVLLPPDRGAPLDRAAHAVTSMSTLPTAPSCTALCAAAVSRQREDVQRETGLAADPDRPVEDGGVHVLDRERLRPRRLGVDQDELPARVGRHLRAHRDGHLVAPPSSAYIATEPCSAMTCASIAAFTAATTSTIASTPCGAIFAHLRDDVLLPVVDDVVGAGGRGQLRLLRAADGGDHGGVGPAGELDRRVADGAGAALHQHRAPAQRAGADPVGQRLGDGQAAVRGEERDAEGGAEFERRVGAEQHGLPRRDDGVLGRRPERALVGRLPDPDPLADQHRVDALADGLDRARAVLVRRLAVRARVGVAPGLPVGRVDAGEGDAHPHLAGPGLGDGPVDQLAGRRGRRTRCRRWRARGPLPAGRRRARSARGRVVVRGPVGRRAGRRARAGAPRSPRRPRPRVAAPSGEAISRCTSAGSTSAPVASSAQRRTPRPRRAVSTGSRGVRLLEVDARLVAEEEAAAGGVGARGSPPSRCCCRGRRPGGTGRRSGLRRSTGRRCTRTSRRDPRAEVSQPSDLDRDAQQHHAVLVCVQPVPLHREGRSGRRAAARSRSRPRSHLAADLEAGRPGLSCSPRSASARSAMTVWRSPSTGWARCATPVGRASWPPSPAVRRPVRRGRRASGAVIGSG